MLKQTLYPMIFLSLLSSCSATRSTGGDASPEFLESKGWQHQARFLEQDSFAEYAASITEEVSQHRIPFDVDRSAQEVSMASPAELPPAENCGGNAIGIAILVHGLSDTAFAMRDIATVLTDACYTSRLVLLPGHGTRAGDISTTRLKHWTDTLNYLIDQANSETNNVLLVGFSLGAVLTLERALVHDSAVDGIIALSPAYNLSSYQKAKWAPWLHRLVPWIDRGISDDAMRYEAMPTRGVVETVKAIQQLNRRLSQQESIDIPWLLAQSLDDAVVLPEHNHRLWKKRATHPDSRLVRFYSDEKPAAETSVIDISGQNETEKVLGLSHLAIHIKPDNTHYGRNGNYRNCGLTAPRDRALVETCTNAETVWYGLWSSAPKPGVPLAISTFNPAFDEFASTITTFAHAVAKSAK